MTYSLKAGFVENSAYYTGSDKRGSRLGDGSMVKICDRLKRSIYIYICACIKKMYVYLDNQEPETWRREKQRKKGERLLRNETRMNEIKGV